MKSQHSSPAAASSPSPALKNNNENVNQDSLIRQQQEHGHAIHENIETVNEHLAAKTNNTNVVSIQITRILTLRESSNRTTCLLSCMPKGSARCSEGDFLKF
jgi:hypothetical protein